MTDQNDTLTSLLTALSSAMREAEPVQSRLASLNAEIADYRERLHALMEASGTKSAEGHGIMAVRSHRKSVVVTDDTVFRAYLTTEGLDGAYMRLDMTAAKKDGVKHGWPGVEEQVSDVLSIREAKS